MFSFLKNVTHVIYTWFLVSIFIAVVIADGPGVGTNGKFRVCVVEGRSAYKKTEKFCPVLDEQNSNIECVIGQDNLDCIRRISKGTVDFGVFSAEELMAARWAEVDVLVSNELRYHHDVPFEYEIVAVVDNNAGISTVQDLRDSRLCHPGLGYETDWTDVLANYFELAIVPKQCDPELTLAENQIKASADFFGAACKAGPWVPNPEQDKELKRKYPSLCSLCYSPHACAAGDKFWGRRGPLFCLTDGHGQVAWTRLDDMHSHFGLNGVSAEADSESYSLLCPDGHLQPVTTKHPCVWVAKPWPAVAARRPVAARIQRLLDGINHDDYNSWQSALFNLLETVHVDIKALDNVVTIDDYLDHAIGFPGAYSFRSCNPPRSVAVCTDSLSALAKCSWLQEAASVQGIEPALHCMRKENSSQCLQSVANNEADVLLVDRGDRMKAIRNGLEPILFEHSKEFKDLYVSGAIVLNKSNIYEYSDLRGKRACFSSYEDTAWFSMLEVFRNQSIFRKDVCLEEQVADFFSEVCVPGASGKLIELCDGDKYSGERGALRCLAEGKADVAFIGIQTVRDEDGLEPWYKSRKPTDFRSLCRHGRDNSKNILQNPCYMSWATQGSLMVNQNISTVKRNEIYNTFKHIDNLYNKHYKSYTPVFSLYGTFNARQDILFHDRTESLKGIQELRRERMEFNFENMEHIHSEKCRAPSSSNRLKTTSTIILLGVFIGIMFV